MNILQRLFSLLSVTSKAEKPSTCSDLNKLEFGTHVSMPFLNCFMSDTLSPLLSTSSAHPFDAYKKLVVRSEPYTRTVDIRKIDSIMYSTSDSRIDLKTIEEFGKVTYDYFKANKKSNECGLSYCVDFTDLNFVRPGEVYNITWNGRTAINNRDGSHHFSVLRYAHTGRYSPYKDMVNIDLSIDGRLAERLFQEWHFFVVSRESLYAIKSAVPTKTANLIRHSSLMRRNAGLATQEVVLALSAYDISSDEVLACVSERLVAASKEEIPQTSKHILRQAIDVNALFEELM